jgi:hypothetical protein
MLVGIGGAMNRILVAAALAVTLLVAAAAGSAASSATSYLRFPAGTPPYIAAGAKRTAQSLGDPNATVMSLQLGRFPVIVLSGNFRCNACSVPPGSTAPTPTGRYASLRFDAVTRKVTDFGLSKTKPGSLSGLCGAADCASRRTIALLSALKALQALRPLVTEPFGVRTGKLRCEIRLPVQAYRWIWGSCNTTISLEKEQTVVTFSETWNGLDPNGRRYAPDSPVHHHVWQMIESTAGWVTKVHSGGAYPPQWTR